MSLAADRASASCPEQHRRINAIADQMIERDPEELDRMLDVFYRAMGTLRADRTLIDFSLNLGLTVNEPLGHRDDDTFGVAMGFVRELPRRRLDCDTAAFTGTLTQRASAKPSVPGCVRLPVRLQPQRGITNASSRRRPLRVRTNMLF